MLMAAASEVLTQLAHALTAGTKEIDGVVPSFLSRRTSVCSGTADRTPEEGQPRRPKLVKRRHTEAACRKPPARASGRRPWRGPGRDRAPQVRGYYAHDRPWRQRRRRAWSNNDCDRSTPVAASSRGHPTGPPTRPRRRGHTLGRLKIDPKEDRSRVLSAGALRGFCLPRKQPHKRHSATT